MTKRLSTLTDAVLVAIDVSKHRQEVLIERPEGGRRRRLTVMATKPDYDRLADELTAIVRSPNAVKIRNILCLATYPGRPMVQLHGGSNAHAIILA